MFFLIWATLLFSVSRINAGQGASVVEKTVCQFGFCVTLNEGEITAEAGLCVVIPCSFTPAADFKPKHMLWVKCESEQRCSESHIIFHSNKNNRNVQSRFRGRVSLLEPDVSQMNCSIIINDLTESDSGSYKFRVNGIKQDGKEDELTFSERITVSVKGLIQKPTMMIPLALTEGQQTTLTCTAPGLCSGSDPKITWTWRGAGENDSHITGNMTENLTAVTHRHSSTLTFNASTEHNGTNVTCKVSFSNSITTEETVTLKVTLLPKIVHSRCEVQSEILSCVCISEASPLPTIKWPLLENYTEYSIATMVTNHTVNSTVTLTVKDHAHTDVECVSRSGDGEVEHTITIITSERTGYHVQQCGSDSAVLPWAVAAVSLIVSIICVICMLFLWNTRKKAKPDQEDKTYMSLQKREASPEYDVIGQQQCH